MQTSWVAALPVLAAAVNAQAGFVLNGSLNGPTGAASLVPSNWSNLAQGTSDTVSAAGHPFGTGGFSGIGAIPFASSADGGTFVWSADFFQQSSSQPEGIRQLVSGLTVGQQYAITFEFTNLGLYNATGGIATAAFGAQNYDSSGRWIVAIDGGQVGVTEAVGVAGAGQQVWQDASVVFTAQAGTVELSFAADWVSGGTHVGMGIDGIDLDIVPSPAGSALLLAAAGFAGRRRRG
jgi:hypothetical protein